MEQAFGNVLDAQKQELKDRFRKDRNREGFMGTYFELQIHEMLYRLGCAFEYHHEITPDFRLSDGQVFGIEATVIHGKVRRNEEAAHDQLFENQELETAIEDTGLVLYVHSEGQLRGNLPKSATKAFRDQVFEAIKKQESWGTPSNTRPPARISFNEWHMRGWIVPAPGILSDTPIQVWPSEALIEDTHASQKKIHDTVKRKQKKWPASNHDDESFLVAISGEDHMRIDLEDEVREALYGCSWAEQENTGFVPDLSRTSGVIVFYEAVLGNEQVGSVQLYGNGEMTIPRSLEFLLKRRPLRELFGMR